MSEVPLPIIDFAPFFNGSDKQKVAAALNASLREFGFAYLTNYGLPKEKLDGMFEWVYESHLSAGVHVLIRFAQSKKFFSQPAEVKELAPHPASGAHHRGTSRARNPLCALPVTRLSRLLCTWT
jgi:isopenicillin N synthase-like dioxygenase